MPGNDLIVSARVLETGSASWFYSWMGGPFLTKPRAVWAPCGLRS